MIVNVAKQNYYSFASVALLPMVLPIESLWIGRVSIFLTVRCQLSGKQDNFKVTHSYSMQDKKKGCQVHNLSMREVFEIRCYDPEPRKGLNDNFAYMKIDM